MSERIIFHIDMNSYFASCEQQANPHLRGIPVGVCEHLGGIIIAPSIEAKRLGIKTGWPVWEARKIYPQIFLLPVDPPKYREITKGFLKIFSSYTDLVERYSIDEAFLDVTHLVKGKSQKFVPTPSNSPLAKGEKKGDEAFLDVTDWLEASSCHSEHSRGIFPRKGEIGWEDPSASLCYAQDDRSAWRDALLLALEIQQRIKREIGEWLTCSVGIGPNKLVAKIASELDKPDGVFLVRPEELETLYDRLKLTDIPGIGARMERQLNYLGIFSLRDLRDYPEAKLRNRFGLVGHNLHEMGNLRGSTVFELDEDQIKTTEPNFSFYKAESSEANPPSPKAAADDHYNIIFLPDGRKIRRRRIKSMGHSYTLPRASTDEREIKKLFFKLSEKVASRLRYKNFWGNVISCYVRFDTSPQPSPTSERVPGGWVRLGIPSSGRKNYTGFGRSHRIREFLNDGRLIFGQAWRIFQSFNNHSPLKVRGARGVMNWPGNEMNLHNSPNPSYLKRRVFRPVRMVGVTVSGLVDNIRDEPLFERYKKPQWALAAMDRINAKYGDFTLRRAMLVDAQNLAPDTVGFGRMKEIDA